MSSRQISINTINGLIKSSGGFDITGCYEYWREQDQKANEGLEEGEFHTEGKVVYVTIDRQTWTPVKCKPECIEQIHWSRGVIPYNSVYTTVVNALENMEYTEINRDSIRELLLEEYSDEQIDKSMARIDKAIHEVRSHAERVLEVQRLVPDYLNLTGFKPPLDKTGIMRYLSRYFDKGEMRKVYNAVRELGLTRN